MPEEPSLMRCGQERQLVVWAQSSAALVEGFVGERLRFQEPFLSAERFNKRNPHAKRVRVLLAEQRGEDISALAKVLFSRVVVSEAEVALPNRLADGGLDQRTVCESLVDPPRGLLENLFDRQVPPARGLRIGGGQ